MKLQVALDCQTIDEAIAILDQVGNYVDIAEIGSVGMFEGMKTSRIIREKFPHLEILNDLKIHDGGYSGAMAAYEHGADYVTVLGVAEDITISEAVRAKKECGIKVIVDMIGCRNIAERLKEVDKMGVDYIAVHLAIDAQSADTSPLEQLKIANLVVKNSGISVAGGIGLKNIEDIVSCHPNIVVSGNAICGSDNLTETAKKMKDLIEKNG